MARFLYFILAILLLAGCCDCKTTSTTSAEDGTCPLCATPKSRASLLVARIEAETPPTVELKVIKLDALLQDVQTRPGKLVVVDIWADFCLPCKKGFPHLVELNQKYSKDDVACISVCVDQAKAQPSALAFLKKQQAIFTNYLLDEESGIWQEHFKITAIPAVFLYRDGKQLARFDYDDPEQQFTYADVEKAVARLVRAKVKSGPQVGEMVPGPFDPLNVTGPAAGQKKCLYCANAGNPVALVFARTPRDTVMSLLKKLDQATTEQRLGCFAVFCSEAMDLQTQLETFARKEKLQLPLCIDTPAGPDDYKVATEAEVTVILYDSKSVVRVNHAFAPGELNDSAIDRIIADLSKIKR